MYYSNYLTISTMSKSTGHKLYRKFERDRAGNLTRRGAVLPTQGKPDAPSFKTRAENLSKDWCSKEGATFLHINFKKRTLHFLDANGSKKCRGLVLDAADKKKYER